MSRKINHKISQRLAPIFGRRPGTRFVSQVNTVGTRDLLINKKPRVSCQDLHIAQTEDIQLKSTLEEKYDVSLTTGSTVRQ